LEGKYPRSVRVQLVDAVPSREDEFNFWYNYIHVPDVLRSGVFDRAYRYEAIRNTKSKYLIVWESDFVSLPSAASRVDETLNRLKVEGRMWPVGEIVWTCDLFAIGHLAPHTGKTATFMAMNQTNCEDSSREEEFNRWYNEMHVPEYLGAGYHYSAYRYQQYVTPKDGEGKFMALYESEEDPATLPQIANEISQRHMPIWYEPLGDNRLKVRQQEGKSRPQDLVFQTLPVWASTWRPIFYKEALSSHGGQFM
jgi:hypothetical protein